MFHVIKYNIKNDVNFKDLIAAEFWFRTIALASIRKRRTTDDNC